MSTATDQKISAFPSPVASKDLKIKPQYGLDYAKAIWSEYTKNANLYNTRRSRDLENRRYAEGLESIQKYKDRLGLNGDTSYLNLDFSPVNRIATIVDNIEGKLMNQYYKIQCNPLDPESKTKYDDYRRELYADMFLKQFAPELEQRTGIPLVPKNKKVPDSDDEAELHLKLNYKMDASIAMEEALQFVFMNNDSENVRRKILRDLIVLKRAATYRYYDENKNIKYEYVDPVDVITPYSKYDDFRNIPYVAVIKQYTINEIAIMNPAFTDAQLFDIAKSQQGKNFNPSWNWGASYEGYYVNDPSFTKPYFNFNIAVLEYYFLTPINEVSVKKNNSKGGFFYESKSDKYTGVIAPESIVVTENDGTWQVKGDTLKVSKKTVKTIDDAKIYFAKIKTDKKNENTEIITKRIKYRFEGKWIPGTEYNFGYKMSENIEREKVPGSYSPECELPIFIIAPNIYDMENKAIVERMIPFEDQINLANLKFQQLLIKAAPPGIAFDINSAIETCALMGTGKMQPMDLLRIWQETGSIPYVGISEDGKILNQPVINLPNGIGRDFEAYIRTIQHYMEMINGVIGFNDAVDASSPNSETLVGTQKNAIQATNNSLRPLYMASITLITKQAKQLALMIQDSIEFNNEAFIQAIGLYATKTLAYGRKLAFNQFAIAIELLPDDEEKGQIEIQLQLGQQSGVLFPSDVIRIRQVLKEDVKAAGQLLVLLEEKNRKSAQQQAMMLQKQNGDVQIQSAQAASQADAQTDTIKTQNLMQFAEFEFNLKSKLSAQEDKQAKEQILLKNQGLYTVAEIQTGGKVEVQEAANRGKIVAQEVANQGKEIVEDKKHGHELIHTAFSNATKPEKKEAK